MKVDSTITLTLPAFGVIVPGQGGYFAGIMRGSVVDGIEAPPYALLVADEAGDEAVGVAWGKYGEDVPGCASRTDGLANTEAMLAAGCPAARRARECDIGGHGDWYLPALGELNMAAANVPELFSKDGYYWSSTQDSRISAFVQGFEIGISHWGFKDYEHRVRAFRRIPLELLNTSTL
jgi:hypothetical protein